MIAFIEAYRADYGVAPICRVLPIAPSTFYHQGAVARDPAKASTRARRDRELMAHIRRIWQENRAVYGAREVWRNLRREGRQVARSCPDDRVNRQFRAEVPTSYGSRTSPMSRPGMTWSIWRSSLTGLLAGSWAGKSRLP